MVYCLTFHPATLADINWIYGALENTASENKVSDRFSLTAQQLEKFLFTEHSIADVLIARLDHKAVGFALFSVTNRNFNLFPSPGIYIHNLYVDPKFRRKKIGTQLMNQLKSKAREKKYCRIDWVVLNNNVEGDRFFKAYEGAKEVNYISYQRINL